MVLQEVTKMVYISTYCDWCNASENVAVLLQDYNIHINK